VRDRGLGACPGVIAVIVSIIIHYLLLPTTRGLVVKQLTRKLGNLSPELLSRVNGLNLDRVEALAEDLLDFTSVGDLERWLIT
jgi:Domain of unknown function (DUF4351)